MSDGGDREDAAADLPRGRAGPESGMELEPDLATEPGAQDLRRTRRTRYPLNSRQLTLAHLRTIAEALGLPRAGSANQLRQCIEGKLQTEREDPNVVVVARENTRGETILVLADSEGDFLETEPVSTSRQPTRQLPPTLDGEEIPSEIQQLRRQLEEEALALQSARTKVQEQAEQIAELQAAVLDREEQVAHIFEEEVTSLRQALQEEKQKVRKSWKMHCEQLAEQDIIVTELEEEVRDLKQQLSEPRSRASRGVGTMDPPPASTPEVVTPCSRRSGPTTGSIGPDLPTEGVSDTRPEDPTRPVVDVTVDSPERPEAADANRATVIPPCERPRRGKAPPIDFFSGKNPAILLDDWVPSLERAAQWNGWTAQEKLIQFPGYLKGKALQEWHLLTNEDQQSYSTAIDALRVRLDPRNKTMAAQEFRHSLQWTDESVAEFIRRIEKAYQIAYGKDALSNDTRDALLYGQLYEGLRYELMRGPTVSGSQGYQELCIAAKAEERRLAALKQRQRMKPSQDSPSYPRAAGSASRKPSSKEGSSDPTQEPGRERPPAQHNSSISSRRCFNCGKTGHLAFRCRQSKKESRGQTAATKQVQSKRHPQESEGPTCATTMPEDHLYSSSDEESTPRTYSVRVSDKGSITQCVKVYVQGVPAYGLVDSGADISIIGGSLFKKVATVARLRKRDLKKVDKTPRTYDQKTFHLDGRMDLDVSFGEKTLCTPVYIKMDAVDQLLLSEGVCRQLGIISYHPEVESWRGKRRKPPPVSELKPAEGQDPDGGDDSVSSARVPLIRVNLVQTVHLLPHQSKSKVVEVRIDADGRNVPGGPLLLESARLDCGADLETALIQPTTDGVAYTVVSNWTGMSLSVEEDSNLGGASTVTVVDTPEPAREPAPITPSEELVQVEEVRVAHVRTKPPSRRVRKLMESIGSTELLTPPQRQELLSFLHHHHDAFVLDDIERGETDLVEMAIDTGQAQPRRCPPRRMPFAVRQEVASQLKNMQRASVIQPSTSPWASPVVMVKKKDGTHRFCVDYRQLNEVTRADTYPLPRIDDLLDQLGQCKYFSTLDLAAGYWQIRVEASSREKTAFVTPQGLFEFLVMPFGLTNAPAVFQRLMQRVLAGLNPDAGPDFVAVYIDDVLVFSRTLEEHLSHLQAVIERIQEAGLKLKPVKCSFAHSEVEYLGHLVTPEGLKTKQKLVEAITQFPQPTDVRGTRRFLGLASYYRRFVKDFSKIAEPLRELTRKNAVFQWTEVCEQAMARLKDCLTHAPVLAYPSFDKPYTVETDASICGLGAIVSQIQDDAKLHPIAYASRSLTATERNYSITELEALAVVWALTRFHSYFYGQSVTVITDHAAVKAFLETPSPSGKHARWWAKVYGAGVKDVRIVYRAGKLNVGADALSRSPQGGNLETGTVAEANQGLKTTNSLTVEESGRVAVIETGSLSEPHAVPAEIEAVLSLPPASTKECDFAKEQGRDPDIAETIAFIQNGDLPQDDKRARRIALQKSLFTMEGGILYYVDPRQGHRRRVVVPRHLRLQILTEQHAGPMSGHFSMKKTYGALARHWWWDGMYYDTLKHVMNCPQCVIVSGGGRPPRPPLHPIPVKRPFQIVGVDFRILTEGTVMSWCFRIF